MTRKFAPPPTKFGPGGLQAKNAPVQTATARGVVPPPPTRFGAVPTLQAKVMVPPPRPGAQVMQPMMPGFITAGNPDVMPYNSVPGGTLGLRLHGFGPFGGGDAGKRQALQLPLPNYQARDDEDYIDDSIANLESQALTVTKRLESGTKALAQQTEVLGEAAGLMALLNSKTFSGYQMLLPSTPGHGAGVDGFLGKSLGGKMDEFMVLEAKGPGAKLTKGQLSEHWIVTRLARLSRSQVPDSAKDGALEALLSIKSKTIRKVHATTVKARWDKKRKKLSYSTSIRRLDLNKMKAIVNNLERNKKLKLP